MKIKTNIFENIVYLREDLNTSGSFKDRLANYLAHDQALKNYRRLLITSSGNFANALITSKLHNSHLWPQKMTIFVKSNIPTQKFTKLQNLVDESTDIELVTTDLPKRAAMKIQSEHKSSYYLRASKLANAYEAYFELGQSIIELTTREIPDVDSLFICTSSGTASQGIISKFIESKIRLPIILVQTTSIDAIVKKLPPQHELGFSTARKVKKDKSLANAIADRVGIRRSKIIEYASNYPVYGIAVNNNDLRSSLKYINSTDLKPNAEIGYSEFNYNSIVSLAGYKKMKQLSKHDQTSYNFNKPVVIISGY